LREICPQKKCTPKYNAASGIIAGELLKGKFIVVPHFSVKRMPV
jgi:hypothetical protein